ncbi:hypothetical protein FG379_003091 [Cryptosporidium bovis]|uniref:uncharacterized protein n=1 Tax=Cryptosporidium bovis TaxID=310047 RepID=UPI00351A09E4|nr:hypothetical protein FG379_003091 [Cryptosporidium bovis]
MVLVSDFNKEINGLLKSKYPSDDKLLELNISSLSKNPTHNYSITTLGNIDNVLKNGLTKNENLTLMHGNSTFKWDALSTKIETKVDVNGLSVFEAKTKPKCGLSLTARYETNSKNSGLASTLGSGSSPCPTITNNRTIEIGGDLQNNNFHTRLRLYPTIEMLGCVNKLSKERNSRSTGINISSTATTSKLISPSSISFGVMMSNNEISYNSMKVTLGLLLKGPLFWCTKEIGNDKNKQDCFYSLENRLFSNNDNNANRESMFSSNSNSACQPNYSISLQTNTSGTNSNKISGFTGGICLGNLMNGFLTLGASLTYNTKQELEMINGNNNDNGNGGILMLNSGEKTINSEEGSAIDTVSPKSLSPNLLSSFFLSKSTLSRIQYEIGGKISFGKMRSINSGENNYEVNGYLDNESISQLNNPSIKSTDIKFKFSNNMNVSYSITHRFNKYISTTFGTSIGLNNANIGSIINNNSDSIKYGFSIDLTA